jgi:hypothetical protein
MAAFILNDHQVVETRRIDHLQVAGLLRREG